MHRIAAVLICTLVAGCATAQQQPTSYAPPPSPAQIDATKCRSEGLAPGTAAFRQCMATSDSERRQAAAVEPAAKPRDDGGSDRY